MGSEGIGASRVVTHFSLQLADGIGQLRACPVRLPGGQRGYFVAYGADFDVDPWHEMFYFPTSTLHLALVTEQGELLWDRDLGPGVVPGMHFCPICAFDLDGDGVDELWFVNNTNAKHPLGVSGYRLERWDARSGECTGFHKWPANNHNQCISHAYRNFIFGGRAYDEPVLVTAQGTYEDMYLQGWRCHPTEPEQLSQRWDHRIGAAQPGARGSHQALVADINNDGCDEVMWGERCIELGTGRELFCADRDVYRGHSDLVRPFSVPGKDGQPEWYLYTIRESDPQAAPRVVVFDATGKRVWGQVAAGHMDMGWVARLGDDRAWVAMAIRIGHKTCGADGRHHHDRECFFFDALTGATWETSIDPYGTVPADLDGDGYHELVYGQPGHDGRVIDRLGQELGSVGGQVALVDHQVGFDRVLVYREDGTLALKGLR